MTRLFVATLVFGLSAFPAPQRTRVAIGALLLLEPRALAAQSGAPASTDDRVAIATALFQYALDSLAHDDVVCFTALDHDPPATVLRALHVRREQIVRPISACRVGPKRRPGDTTSVVADTLTGRHGIRIRVGAATFDARGGFAADVTAYRNALSATTWRCAGVRRGGAWVVQKCAVAGGA